MNDPQYDPQWQPLRELALPQPTPEMVNEACYQVEARWIAEEEAAAQEQLRRMNEAEREEAGE